MRWGSGRIRIIRVFALERTRSVDHCRKDRRMSKKKEYVFAGSGLRPWRGTLFPWRLS